MLDVGLSIDRSNFYRIDDPRIRRMFDGVTRLVAVRDPGAYRRGALDGLRHVHDLQYHVIGDMINVTSFATATSSANQEYREHDIRQGSKLPVLRENVRRGWDMKLQR